MSIKAILKINQEELDSLRAEYGWKGDGTKDNPIIVGSLSILASLIKFIKITSYIIFRNLVISDMQFSNCRNITIEECSILSLTLNSCQDIIVKDNNILNLQVSYGGNNIFANNKMTKKALSRAKKYMNNKTLDYLLIFSIIFLLISVLILLFVETFMKGVIWNLIVPIIFATMIFIIVKIYEYSKKKQSRDLSPNLFKDHIITDEMDIIKPFFGEPFKK